MALRTNKRVILAKIESTYGTDPTPTGSANAILARNLSVTPIQGERVSRDLIRPYLGNSDTLLAETSVTCEFEVELSASGAAGTAPAWGPLLKACGLAETIVASTSATYAPVSASFGSLTLYYNVDGLLHKITGARGTFEISLNVKNIPVVRFTLTGIYNSPSDTAAPTPDFTAFVIPKVVNATNTPTCSIFSYSGKVESVSLNLANDVQHRTLINSDSIEIVDRKPEGSIVLEAPTIAAKDFFTASRDGTTGALSVVHGTGAGNIITIGAPRVSIGSPAYQDSQGIQMLSIPLVISPSSGSDELSLAFT